MTSIPINTTLLQQLGLVQEDQWPRIERRARRMAKGLPLVESVWIDAMLQLGHVTPYQAKQLHEGRAESLQVSSYVILNRRESLGWADCFDAYRIDDRRTVFLTIFQNSPKESWEMLSQQLIQLHIDQAKQETPELTASVFLPIDEVGIDDRHGAWTASPPCGGESLGKWMVRHGRIAPNVVLEIARQMALGLSELEAHEQTHGDLRAAMLLLDKKQGIKLILPGVRAVVRPRESFAETTGPIDMYDGLSPERAAEGMVPDVKSDLFAAGSLWWQMLVGRPPMPGGDGRAKLRAAARKSVEDIKKHAADVPEPLVNAITACTTREREERPDSFQEVVAMLGESDARGQRALRRTILEKQTTALPIASSTVISRHARRLSQAIVAAGILVAVVALGLAADRYFHPPASQVVVLPKPVPRPPVPSPKPEPTPPIDASLDDDIDKVTDDTSQARRLTSDSITRDDENGIDAKTIVLDASKPTTVATLVERLKPGVTVTGSDNKRAQVHLGDTALVINVPGVRFENVDFITSSSEKSSASPTHQAMIELRESEATFSGCTFHGPIEKGSPPRTVLHWIFPDEKNTSTQPELETKLHNGRIVFENCVFGRETGTALHAEVHAAVAVELQNVLHVGVGPMLFLETPPKPDEPWRVLADHVTLRDSGPFWACRYTATNSGAVRVEANHSVFAPKGTQPLLLFVGENDPELIFRKIEWTGQGTLMKKTTPTAAWQDNVGNRSPLDDQHVAIDGLIRSQLEFTGPVDDAPTSCLLKTWDAPLASETLPGIEAEKLPR